MTTPSTSLFQKNGSMSIKKVLSTKRLSSEMIKFRILNMYRRMSAVKKWILMKRITADVKREIENQVRIRIIRARTEAEYNSVIKKAGHKYLCSTFFECYKIISAYVPSVI